MCPYPNLVNDCFKVSDLEKHLKEAIEDNESLSSRFELLEKEHKLVNEEIKKMKRRKLSLSQQNL